MTLRGNHFLRNENLVADGAVLALSLAGFGASRLNSRINDLGMALGRDFFLGNEYSIADRAVLAFGQTSLSAGWSLCCIDYFCVAGRGDFFHTGENRITNGALRTGFMTSLGAGSGLFRNFNRSMSSRVDCFGLGCIANCAGVGLDAGFLTGRSGRDLALIPAVAISLNSFTLGDFLAADGADCITGVAVLGAGGILLVDHLGERMFVRPAGLEGQIGKSKQFWLCPGLIIEFFLLAPFAHLDHAGNQPALEGVTLASKATFGKRVILAGLAVDDLYRIHRADAAVGIKSDGELFKLVVHRREINVLMRIESPAVDPLHLIIGSPAIQELIGVVFILGHCGFRVYLKPHIVTCFFLTGIVTFL